MIPLEDLGKFMNKEQIESWAKLGESETLELKRSTGERKEATKTICAMLNNRGGRVLFGIEPSGKIIGQDVSDHTVEEVAQELKNIEPPVFPNIDRVFVDGRREVLIITVTTGANQPYSYKGDAYKRVGNTSQTMSRDEYNRVLIERLHSERRWENEASTDWAIDDLDGNEIVKTLEEAIRRGRAEDPRTRDPLEILRGFGLVRDGKILRAAVVLFGNSKKIETSYPQMLLRIAKFKGIDKTEFLDNRQFHGNALDLLSKAEKFFRENLPISSVVQEGKMARTDTPLYPPIALREALANAFCHRDYSIGGGSISIAIYENRVEISSSGSLHFGLTSEALFKPHESMPWNPLIARVFYRSGIIESWGRGTLKMLEETRDAGLIEPTIVDSGGSVTVCFKSSPLQVAKLTDRQKEILKILIMAKDGLALREIHEKLPEVSDRQIREDLATLQTLGLAYSYGHGRGAGWKSHL